jgi:hypothetical protein
MKFWYGSSWTARLVSLALCCVIILGAGGPALARSAPKVASGKSGASKGPGSPTSIDTMPRLGAEGQAAGSDDVLQALTDAGVGFVRVQLNWTEMEPVNTSPENYNWAPYDATFARIAVKHMAPLVTVVNCPSWACVRDIGPLADNSFSDFGIFMSALAARYSQAPYNVHYWELWNEPDGTAGADHSWGWGMHADKYAQMLATIYPAVKAVDPQSVIMTGGIAYDFWLSEGGPFNPDFLGGLLDSGAGPYLDAVAFHFYKNNAHGWTNIGLKTAAIRAIMDRRGVTLPLVCTESGLTSSSDFGSSEQIQARYLVQSTTQGAASGLRAQSWYLDRDYESPDPSQDVFAMSGLLRLDNTRKPAQNALRVFAQEVGSGDYLRQLGPDDGVVAPLVGYRFQGTVGLQVSVVWSNSGQVAMSIPAANAPGFVRAVSLGGLEVPTQPGPGGTLLLNVDLDPVYLEWHVQRFDDVPVDSWMYPYVEYLASRGVVSGYTDGTFRPGNSATRGQFSKMLVLGMGWPIDTTGGPHFMDAPTSHTFYGYIETAFNRGIISGYACGGDGEPCPGLYFRPGNNITRGQIAKIVDLGKAWPLIEPGNPTFIDVPIGSPFYSYIETAVAHGLVSGYGDGTFRPGNNATRAQLSKILTLALQQP